MTSDHLIALAGNPNSGKSTLFSEMTGMRQQVANYPGVTVEKKVGVAVCDGAQLRIVDLPGTYSLVANSPEEAVARHFLMNEHPDVIIAVVDASNLERHLYLAIQLMELRVPMVLALNMADVARKDGIVIDREALQNRLGLPIVETVGNKGLGIKELLHATHKAADSGVVGHEMPAIVYPPEIVDAINNVAELITRHEALTPNYRPQDVARGILEGDTEVFKLFAANDVAPLQAEVNEILARLETTLGMAADVAIARARYAYIKQICAGCMIEHSPREQYTISDRIDAIVTHRFLALPIFALMMFLVFQLVFAIGEYPMEWLETLFAFIGERLTAAWPNAENSPLCSLIVDGIIGGVGGVLVFLPNILLLFLAIAILESSGYMARAGLIMDQLMQKIGLHGKSFIPMLIGFGCTVPAIMATRTLENRRDRLTTMFIAPLMSCGARLPIYTLIIPAFFAESWRAPILFLIYFTGIMLAVILAKVLTTTVFKGESEQFIMELPPYRIPTLKSVLLQMWERGVLYLRKAGTIILAISIIMWALVSYPQKTVFDHDYDTSIAAAQTAGNEELVMELENQRSAESLSYSAAGRVGHALQPLLAPMGFDWRIGTALIGAFAAKEVFVSQLGVVFSLGEADDSSDSLRAQLRKSYSPLVAFCIMLFCLISTPCMATVAIMRRESNSWKWPLWQFATLTLFAWVITTVVYQIGMLLKIGL